MPLKIFLKTASHLRFIFFPETCTDCNVYLSLPGCLKIFKKLSSDKVSKNRWQEDNAAVVDNEQFRF